MERKLLLILLKYMPVVMMALVIVNNIIILSSDSYMFNGLLNYLFGNSLICSVLMILSSYVFLYCIWQRVIIYTNLILIMFTMWVSIFDLGYDVLYYIAGFHVIIALGVLMALFLHLNNRLRCTKSRIIRSEKSSKRNERLIYFIVKWLPLFSLLLLMFDNLLNYYECNIALFDFSCNYLFGNSVIFSTLLFVLSRVLKIGEWNRALIIANALILVLGMIYYVYINGFECEELSDLALISIMYFIQISGLIVSLGLAVKSHAKESAMSLKLSD